MNTPQIDPDFLARWWEFRPTSGGIIVIATGMVLVRSALEWPMPIAVVVPVLVYAAWMAACAALDLGNEQHADSDDESEEEGTAGSPAVAAGIADEGHYTSLREGGESR